MRVSVLIPSHGRPAKLAACVAGLAAEVAGDEPRGRDVPPTAADEVLVGLDGPDPASEAAANAAWTSAGAPPERLAVCAFPRRGANEVRAELLERATGDVILTLNDDVVPGPGFVRAHRRRQALAPAIVVGHSPYLPVPDETVLDRLVARTGLVFPWPRLRADPDAADHGYRAAVTLNVSIPAADLRAVGGFTPSDGVYGHDDLELGFRLQRERPLAVRFAAEAVAGHDHRHEPVELLRRDALLGASMWHYAQRNADFARDLVGHDVRDGAVRDHYRRFVEFEHRDAVRAAARFVALGRRPVGVLGAAADDDAVLDALAAQATPARRVLWRRGLLDAADGTFDADQVLAEVTDARPFEAVSVPAGSTACADDAAPATVRP